MIEPIKVVSSIDGTIKILWKLSDGEIIESVLVPPAGEIVKWGLCVSTQVGCPYGCVFCASGKEFVRNLRTSEIINQILGMLKLSHNKGLPVNTILFTGMGEPLLNYNNVVTAIKIILDKNARLEKYTLDKNIFFLVSTVGVVPNIYKLAEERLPVILHVSLHASRDDIRQKLMPRIPYSVDEILMATKYYMKKVDTQRLLII